MNKIEIEIGIEIKIIVCKCIKMGRKIIKLKGVN